MLFKSLAIAAFCAATQVVADGAAIISVVNTIRYDNLKLNDSVVEWDGSLFGALPILGAATDLENAINNGTAVANASAPLSTNEAVALYTAVQALSTETNVTINNFIAAKPKFDSLGLTFIASSELKTAKTDVDQFAAAIVAKIPAALQSFAEQVVAQIDATFDRVAAVYAS